MSSVLAHQRCFNHQAREAAARCPECREFFCRECITEHGLRVLCASCLRKTAPVEARASRGWMGFLRWIPSALGILAAFCFFYSLGRFLLTMPTQYHEGTLWRKSWDQLTRE